MKFQKNVISLVVQFEVNVRGVLNFAEFLKAPSVSVTLLVISDLHPSAAHRRKMLHLKYLLFISIS